jgi:hypothetical protein
LTVRCQKHSKPAHRLAAIITGNWWGATRMKTWAGVAAKFPFLQPFSRYYIVLDSPFDFAVRDL